MSKSPIIIGALSDVIGDSGMENPLLLICLVGENILKNSFHQGQVLSNKSLAVTNMEKISFTLIFGVCVHAVMMGTDVCGV